MTDNPANTLFGQSPTRYGVTSLVAALFALASWPLMVVIGFVMVYAAILLAFVAILAGLLGVGAGMYFKDWVGVVTGVFGLGLACSGVGFIVSAVTHF